MGPKKTNKYVALIEFITLWDNKEDEAKANVII